VQPQTPKPDPIDEHPNLAGCVGAALWTLAAVVAWTVVLGAIAVAWRILDLLW
jgi:hypothetical protein